jgi:serine/threonine protein kinase/tetratricopeptide (TPR) repeat protein
MIGKNISHYQILEKLGEGGMGEAYKAQDTKLNRMVALKFLPPALSSDKDTRTRFIKEAQTASALDHPNICSIYEIGETEDGRSYIAMACYEGQTLKEKLVGAHHDAPSRGATPIPIGQTISIVIQIAKGLARAHEEGIIHRDIKPANIMITKRGEVKILDFGLAKLAGQTRLTRTGTTLGTAAYMSPEQARGTDSDRRSDIWSLGVVLYEMLTGELPFKGEFEQAMIYTIINEDPEPIDEYQEIPEELKAIVSKALTKDPDQRFQTIEELLQEFQPISDEARLPVELPLKKVVQKIWRKHKVVSMIAAAVLAILFILWILKPGIIPESPKGPQEIAVISFENMTGDPEDEYLTNFIPSLLRTALGQSNQVRVLTWDYMNDLLKQMGIRDVKTINREMGYQISNKAGISTLITGTFAKVGKSYVTDIKVIDPATKDIIIPVSARGEDISSILDRQIDELSQAILEGIDAIDSSYLVKKKPVQEITTSSSEAYRYFVRGGEIGANNFDESIRYLERAVEIDSTFAQAYLALYELYFLSGPHEKCVDATIKAYRHVDHAPPDGTRDLIYAAYAEIVEKNMEKYARFLSAGLKKNPYNKQLWSSSSWYYYHINNWTEAINCIEKALAIDPEYKDGLISACYIYAWYGDKTKTIEYIEKYMMADPGNPNTMDTAGDAYYILGMFEESLQQFRELNRMYPERKHEFRSLYIHILQENYDQAREELDRYLEERSAKPASKAHAHSYRALFFYYMGEIARAFAELDSILTKNDIPPKMISKANALKGYLLLQQKDIAGARNAFHYFRSDPDKTDIYNVHKAMICFVEGKLDSSRYYRKKAISDIEEIRKRPEFRIPHFNLRNAEMYCDLLQAELLLASDSTDQAIDYYNEIRFPEMFKATVYSLVSPLNMFYNIPLEKDIIPRVLIKKGDIEGAIEAYEKLVDFRPGKREHFIINPIYHYRLAKLYQQTGQIQKAIDRYRRFLEIWKYADEGLPQLIDAKKRLAALTNTK